MIEAAVAHIDQVQRSGSEPTPGEANDLDLSYRRFSKHHPRKTHILSDGDGFAWATRGRIVTQHRAGALAASTARLVVNRRPLALWQYAVWLRQASNPDHLCGCTPEVMAEVELRLTALKEIAAEEGTVWSSASETALRGLLAALSRPEYPALALDGNGELRAVWFNDKGEQIGVRFKKTGVLEALLFQLRPQDGCITRVTTIGSIANVVDEVARLGLDRLLHD